MYWYDSCGTQGSYVGTCGQTNSTLTLTKTVKDITTNTAFSTSTYANPSDMLMFMITLQANGSDAQNVYIRDVLPANLIYNNQLVVACTGTTNGSNNCNNSNYNYSGSITSGINLNTIYSGQTVTITYQVQVAPTQNFSYGITTLSNSVSATSSQSGSVPNASASVIVTRAGVLGASTVSTGLTNNFFGDSFFLPLLLALIGLWMWKTGIFFGIKKWIVKK
jgi:fimbrial isopeptide formation D2 family protein